MKAVKYRWNQNKMIWWAYKNDDTVAVAKEICGYSAPIAPDNSAVQTRGVAVAPKKYHPVTNKIYRTVSGSGTHYFNVINGQVFDLNRDQFDLYNLSVDYSSSTNAPIQYCGKNANTKDRYDILEKNLIKNKEVYCNE